MEHSNFNIMKRFLAIFLITLMFACGQDNSSPNEILEASPYLIGKWEGAGGFFDKDLNKIMGEVPIKINITSPEDITVTIGEAGLKEIEMHKTNYGIELKGLLDKNIKDGIDLNKDHVIFLLVFQGENLRDLKMIDANFHVKTNYFFDFSMRVGGVMLKK